MDARRIRPLFLPPHPRRNQYIPSSNQIHEVQLSRKARQHEPMNLIFLSKTKGKLSFLLRTTLMFFLPKSNPFRWASILNKNNDRSGTSDKVLETKN